MKRIILILLVIVLLPVTNAHAGGSVENAENTGESVWLKNFTNTVDNSFFFVADKIIDLQEFFIKQAWAIGRVVLLIAVLTAALNYALTGQGLKENVIKIMKATLFFIIVTLAYPKIIGFISSWTYQMAYRSVYPSVSQYFHQTVEKTVRTATFNKRNRSGKYFYWVYSDKIIEMDIDYSYLFPNLTKTSNHPKMEYTSVAPAAVINLIFLLAGECFTYADNKENKILPEFSRILKGLICAFFIIMTGIFALLEYVICFLEFLLVASVGVILFPLSIWEGSKFLSEKFIGAIIGFFIKLLFCNIVIFLMIYGFISLFHVISSMDGFKGTPDQIVFIIFTCLLFFYICKSAPGMAQGLLSGTPSLSATGAISAAGGALAAAGATMGLAKKGGGLVGSGAGKIAQGGLAMHGALSEAGAASGAAKTVGGTGMQQVGAFMSSLGDSAKDAVSAKGLGLARSIMSGGSGGGGSGGGLNPHSWSDSFTKVTNKNGEQKTYKEHIQERKTEGAGRGLSYMIEQNSKRDAKQALQAQKAIKKYNGGNS
jgi:type IV secretory pathway TrbL component